MFSRAASVQGISGATAGLLIAAIAVTVVKWKIQQRTKACLDLGTHNASLENQREAIDEQFEKLFSLVKRYEHSVREYKTTKTLNHLNNSTNNGFAIGETKFTSNPLY